MSVPKNAFSSVLSLHLLKVDRGVSGRRERERFKRETNYGERKTNNMRERAREAVETKRWRQSRRVDRSQIEAEWRGRAAQLFQANFKGSNQSTVPGHRRSDSNLLGNLTSNWHHGKGHRQAHSDSLLIALCPRAERAVQAAYQSPQ